MTVTELLRVLTLYEAAGCGDWVVQLQIIHKDKYSSWADSTNHGGCADLIREGGAILITGEELNIA